MGPVAAGPGSGRPSPIPRRSRRIDFEGLNAISMGPPAPDGCTRAAAARAEHTIRRSALEEANPDLTGAEGVNQIPDLVVRLALGSVRTCAFPFGLFRRRKPHQTAILCASCAARSRARRRTARNPVHGGLRHQRERRSCRPPWARSGTSCAGPGTRARDRSLQVSTRFGRVPGRLLPRATHEADELVRVSRVGGNIGYEHWWRPRVRSDATVRLRLGGQPSTPSPGDALRRTELIRSTSPWSPIPRLDLVAEYPLGAADQPATTRAARPASPARRHLPLLGAGRRRTGRRLAVRRGQDSAGRDVEWNRGSVRRSIRSHVPVRGPTSRDRLLLTQAIAVVLPRGRRLGFGLAVGSSLAARAGGCRRALVDRARRARGRRAPREPLRAGRRATWSPSPRLARQDPGPRSTPGRRRACGGWRLPWIEPKPSGSGPSESSPTTAGGSRCAARRAAGRRW